MSVGIIRGGILSDSRPSHGGRTREVSPISRAIDTDQTVAALAIGGIGRLEPIDLRNAMR